MQHTTSTRPCAILTQAKNESNSLDRQHVSAVQAPVHSTVSAAVVAGAVHSSVKSAHVSSGWVTYQKRMQVRSAPRRKHETNHEPLTTRRFGVRAVVDAFKASDSRILFSSTSRACGRGHTPLKYNGIACTRPRPRPQHPEQSECRPPTSRRYWGMING